MKPFQRIGKRDKPVWLEEQEEEPCQRVRKRDKPVLKKTCYIKVDCCSGEIVFVKRVCEIVWLVKRYILKHWEFRFTYCAAFNGWLLFLMVLYATTKSG